MYNKNYTATRGAPDKNLELQEESISPNNLTEENFGTDTKAKRMTIQLTVEAAKSLEWLANFQGISQVEALRRAISTEAYLQREIQQGAKVLVQQEDSIKVLVFR